MGDLASRQEVLDRIPMFRHTPSSGAVSELADGRETGSTNEVSAAVRDRAQGRRCGIRPGELGCTGLAEGKEQVFV